MRRNPTPRDGRSESPINFDPRGRARVDGLDEQTSFAPVGRATVSHLETGYASPMARRDLAALQLLEAAESAMRLARTPQESSLWSARAFSISDLVDNAVTGAATKARSLGIALTRWPDHGDAATQVIGEPHRLGQVLHKLVTAALEARGATGLRLGCNSRRDGHRLVADVTLWLDRGPLQSSSAIEIDSDEIEIDSELSLVLSPAVFAAAIGMHRDKAGERADLAVTLRLRLPLGRIGVGFAMARASESPEPSALDGLSILLVEDIDLNREMLRMLLSPFGCSLAEATDGREAVTALGDAAYDVILMDLQLPQMDGFEAIRRIRARDDDRASTPILAVSGRAMAADIARAKAAGADGHLAKPYTTDELVSAIVKCRKAAGRG